MRSMNMTDTAPSQANDAEQLRMNIAKLLDLVGHRRECIGCGRPIWLVLNCHGKYMPITGEALNHFIDCPKADTLRKVAQKE